MSDKENVRLRFETAEKAQIDAVWERSGISQQEAFTRLARWFAGQDETLQAMILGQIPASPDLVAMVLGRMSGPRDLSLGHAKHLRAARKRPAGER